MIALDLQSVLISEFRTLFTGQLFPAFSKIVGSNPDPAPLNIYTQALPQEGNGNLGSYAPYLVVQLISGKQDDEIGPEDVKIILNVGIHSYDKQNQGHIFVLNIIETIRQHLFLKRTFGNKYFITLPFEWQVNDDDIFPYFVGSVETHWELPIILPDSSNL
jgi:hypothetical protein